MAGLIGPARPVAYFSRLHPAQLRRADLQAGKISGRLSVVPAGLLFPPPVALTSYLTQSNRRRKTGGKCSRFFGPRKRGRVLQAVDAVWQIVFFPGSSGQNHFLFFGPAARARQDTWSAVRPSVCASVPVRCGAMSWRSSRPAAGPPGIEPRPDQRQALQRPRKIRYQIHVSCLFSA